MGNRSIWISARRLAPFAVALLLSGCGGATKLEFSTDAPGNFRVLAAGKPAQSQQTLSSPAGDIRLTSLESVDGDRIRRLVVYADLPGPIVESTAPDALLDGGIRGMSGKGQWTVQGEVPITLDGHPGRDVRFAVNSPPASEKGTGRARILVIGSRLYQAIMVGPASRVTEENLDQFVKSFELLQKVPVIASAAPVALAARDSRPSPTMTPQVAGPPASAPAPAAEPDPEPRDAEPAPTVVAQEAPSTTPPPAQDARPAPARTPRPRPPVSAAPPRRRPPAGDRVVQVGDVGPDPTKPAEVAIQANRSSRRFTERPEPRGNAQERFREAAPDRGVLVGMRVGYVEIFGGPKVAMIQPIFQKGNTYIEGTPFGKEIPPEMTLVARPGYAVGTINTRTGLTVDAFQVVFVRVKDGHFISKDFYTSDWLGDPRGGGPTTATGLGKLIVGIHGHSNGREINSLGVLVAE